MKLLIVFTCFAALSTSVLAHHDDHHHDHDHHHDEICGFKPPPKEESSVVQARIMGSKTIDELKHGQRRSLTNSCKQCISIDTYFHLFLGHTEHNNIGSFIPHPQEAVDRLIAEDPTLLPEEFSSKNETIELIKLNMELLNQAFVDTPFFFNFVEDEVTETTNTEWTLYTIDYFPYMSRDVGKGDIRKLDVFISYSLNSQEGASLGDGELLGFAVLPSIQLQGFGDGVYMRYDVLTGGEKADRDLGYTLVHECGHWLGLYHTFETTDPTTTCDPQDPNDYVDDTPAQSGPTQDTVSDCTVYLDDNVTPLNSCPNLPGNDAMFNYLNYLDNEYCWDVKGEFSPKQVERMMRHWSLFRDHQLSCDDDNDMEIEVVVTFDEDHATENKIILQDQSGAILFDSDEDHRGPVAYILQQTLFFDICVPKTQAYSLTVLDSASDGFSNGKIHVYRNRELLDIVQGDSFSHQRILIPPARVPFAATVPPPLSNFVESRRGGPSR